MNSKFNDILLKCKVTNNKTDANFVGMIESQYGNYSIEGDNLEIFYNEWCEELKKNKNAICGIAEKQNASYSPLLGEIDIHVPLTTLKEITKANKEHNQHNNIDEIEKNNKEEKKEENEIIKEGFLDSQIYNEDHIIQIVKIYQTLLRTVLKECKREHLICFVLEKEKPYIKNSLVRSGFHLHFPFCIINNIDNEIHILPRIRQEVKSKEVFEDLRITEYDKVVDSPINKPWLIYGARKDERLLAYKLTKIYDDNLEVISLAEALKISRYELKDIYENIIPIREELEYYLPRILAVNTYGMDPCKLDSKLECLKEVKPKKLKEIKRLNIDNKSVKEQLSIAKELLTIISKKRIDDHNQWIELGWILFNIGEGSNEALKLWINFSGQIETVHDRTETRCIAEWKRMDKRNYTIGSLKYLASIDNKKEYKKYTRRVTEESFSSALECTTQQDIADVLYNTYGHIYVCTSLSKDCGEWYEYKRHRWHSIESGYTLWNKIKTDIIPRVNEYGKKISKEIYKNKDKSKKKSTKKGKRKHSSDDEEDSEKDDDDDDHDDDDDEEEEDESEDSETEEEIKKQKEEDKKQEEAEKERDKILEGKRKSIDKLKKSLKTEAFQKGIMKLCKHNFYKPPEVFLNLLDTDPYLIGCENGILDLKNKEFRDGKPTDYITKSVGYDFKIYQDDKDPELLEVYDLFDKLFVNKNLRKYIYRYLANLLVGRNTQKNFVVMSGAGDNGKSVFIDLIFKTLNQGTYAIKLPTTVLTGKKASSGNAVPELARSEGARLLIAQEPDNSERCNIGTIKELTGNDSFYARFLYGQGKEINPFFKLVLVCLTGDTKITLSNGQSISIEKMKDKYHQLLTWDEKRNGLINKNQIGFINQGIKKCIELTLLDGTKIKCTPNHKFLTQDNKWIEAKDIEINKTNLKMGLSGINCDDMFENYNYKLEITKEFTYNLSVQEDRFKAAAYCRLLGYVLTDGTCNKTLYFGHMIDGELISNDIKLLTGKIPVISKHTRNNNYNNHNITSTVYQINLPAELTRAVSSICPYQKGGKVNNPMQLPKFIFDEKCPLFLVREFIAGMYGGDGCVPCIDKNRIRPLSLICSKSKEHLQSLIDMYNKLSEILYKRFKISSYISNPYVYDNDKYNLYLIISKQESVNKYIETVGIRYCCHKSYRLLAIHKSLLYKEHIIEQNKKIIEDTKIIKKNSSKHISIKKAYENAIEQNYIINKKYLITYNQVSRYLRDEVEYKSPILKSLYTEFLEITDLNKFCNNGKKIHYSVDRDADCLPVYHMPIIYKKDIGDQQVYDITVEEPFSNFIANGMVSHNCNKLPNMPMDDAIWNRVEVLYFESRFPKNAKEVPTTLEEQRKRKIFPRDPNFNDKLPHMRQAMLWIMFQEYLNNLKEEEYVIPEEVIQASKEYQNSNDVYLQYYNEHILETKDPKDTMTLIDLYSSFKQYVKLSGIPNMNHLQKLEFKKQIIRKIGEPHSNDLWRGMKLLVTDEDQEKAGKCIIIKSEDLNLDDPVAKN